MTDLGELDLPLATVDHILREVWEIAPTALQALESELSTVCRVDLPSKRLVVKATRHTPKAHAAGLWRIDAMNHLDAAGVPVGCSLPSRQGDLLAVVPTPHGTASVLVTEWLDGVPLESATITSTLLRNVGGTASTISELLAGWPAPPYPIVHPWELVRSLDSIESSLPHLTDL